jgi:hypothetical protein
MEKQKEEQQEPVPDPDYKAISRNPKAEWNERMWTPEEELQRLHQVRVVN